MEHSPKIKKLLVKLENKLFDIFYTEVIHYYKKPGRYEEMPLELDLKCTKMIKNFLSKAPVFFQGENPKLTDVPNEAIFALKVKLNDMMENYNNPDAIQLNNNNEPFTLEQILKARKKVNKTNKVNLKERKLQSELRKKEAHELEEQRKREEQGKRNKSFENKLNNFANDPILKGITSKDKKLLSSTFRKMPPKPRTFTRSTKPEEQKKKMPPNKEVTQKKTMPPPPKPRTKQFTQQKRTMLPNKQGTQQKITIPLLKPRYPKPSRRKEQPTGPSAKGPSLAGTGAKGPNVSLNN